MLHVRAGPALVREFTARGVRVFLDLKWHDIPSVVTGAVEAARAQGVAMATVHTVAGAAVVAAAGQAAGEMAVVGVTVLPSHEAGDFERVVGRGVPDLGFEAERLGRLALAAGLRGVVASGHEVTLLRETLGPEPWIVVPGVRTPGDAPDDQARTITLADAVGRGATHLVVGRPITRAADPRGVRSEEHTSELQSRLHLVCRLLLEKKKKTGCSIRPVKERARHIPRARV